MIPFWLKLVIFLVFMAIGFFGHQWWTRWKVRRMWRRQARNTAWLLDPKNTEDIE